MNEETETADEWTLRNLTRAVAVLEDRAERTDHDMRSVTALLRVQSDVLRLQAREILSKRVKCARCRRVATKAIAFERSENEFHGGSFRCDGHDAEFDGPVVDMVDLPDAAALRRLEAFLAEPCT